MEKKLSLQGLRGIAILLVMFYHFFRKFVKNGWIGVDIFFVLSGYLMMAILSQPADSYKEYFLQFYYRRFKRILPVYYFTILVIILSFLHHMPLSFLLSNEISALKASLLVYNIKKSAHGIDAQDYVQTLSAAKDMFTHTWSLCLEMQWYIIIPFIVFSCPKRLLLKVSFLITIAFVSFCYYLLADNIQSFYSVPARAWQFIFGMLAFISNDSMENFSSNETKYTPLPKMESESQNLLLDESDEKADPLLKTPPSIAFPHGILYQALSSISVFLIITLATFDIIPNNWLRFLITWISALVISACGKEEVHILSISPLVYIGDISYILYLVHWPIYIVVKNWSEFSHEEHGEENIEVLYLGILISFIIASGLHHGFEKFYLKWSKTAIISFVGITATLSILLLSNIVWLRSSATMYNVAATPQHDYIASIAASNMAVGGKLNSRKNYIVPDCIKQSVAGLPEFSDIFGLCEKNMTLLEPKGDLKFLVIGNSYALNQADLIFEAFRRFITTFFVFGIAGCEPLAKAHGNCPEFLTPTVNQVKPDIIFVLHRIPKIEMDTTKPIDQDPTFNEMQEMVQFLDANAKKVYIQQALPICQVYCTTLTTTYMIENNVTLKDVGEKFIEHTEIFERVRIEELGRRCKKCEIFDYLPFFEDDNGNFTAYDLKHDQIYFDDEIHLTPRGKERVRPLFLQLAAKFKQ